MTVEELIQKLEKYPKKQQVRIFADHGQSAEHVSDVSTAWVDEDKELYDDSEGEELFPAVVHCVIIGGE